MPGGRPSKFTPALAHTLCVHVSYGCPLETAAAAEGLSPDTVRRWIARYPEFRDQIMQAQGMCVVRLLSYLNRAAAGATGEPPPGFWSA